MRRLSCLLASLAILTVATPAGAQKQQVLTLPKGGKQVDSIPKAFQGLWGNTQACAASRKGEVGEGIAYTVDPKQFGDYFSGCTVQRVRQMSASKIVIHAQCGEEGGLNDNDDGQRLVTMTKAKQTLTVRIQHMNPPADLPKTSADLSFSEPACR